VSRRLRQLSGRRLDDPALEANRREQDEAIAELQGIARATTGVILVNVALEDGIDTPIAHGLGRMPKLIRHGIVRGAVTAGVISEVGRTAETVTLRADDFGATIRVEVEAV
jgi:hypothetical protein